MAMGRRWRGRREKQTNSLTAQLMSAPAGQLLVGALGVGIVSVGVFLGLPRAGGEVHGAARLAKRGPATAAPAIEWLGKVGYLGKGAGLAAVGMLFVTAAVRHQPKQCGGLDVALRELVRQPFGPYLLTAVAVGFAAYGLFAMVWARHLDR